MWVLQSPGEALDWHQDWTDWMEIGDFIQTSAWSINPLTNESGTSPVLSDDSMDTGQMFTTVFVAGLELGKSYQLKNTITTLQGRVGEREITIRCDIQS